MQAIILAAGRGHRLSPITDEVPKPLVEVNGVPLLVNALNCLSRHPIERFIIVLGYRSDMTRQRIGESWNGVEVVYVENTSWERTNNVYSLWLTKELWDQDTLLLECDIFFEAGLIDSFLAGGFRNAVFVDKFATHMDGTVVQMDEAGHISRMIPARDQQTGFDYAQAFKTVNIYAFTKDFLIDLFRPAMDLYIKARGQNEYYELVLSVLVFIGNKDLAAHVCAPHRWFEIDDFTDLQRAQAHVCGRQTLLDKVDDSYGGYWRFELDDFAYLYNSYFPPAAMVNELRLNLDQLLRNYPSGQAEINASLANWIRLDASMIAVANGGAELIAELRPDFGRLALPVPTFAEYERGLPPRDVVPIPLDPDTLRHRPDDIVRFALDAEADSLVLVNPNNPTGQCMEPRQLRQMLRSLRGLRRIVLDESFIDFASPGRELTLLDELAEHPNLVILRSLSKDLGVPGLRLGYAASADRDLVARLRAALPIWHINSIAQHFIDILPKYRAEYACSRERVIADRAEMARLLARLPGVRVAQSRANYHLLELPLGAPSRLVKELLFVDHGILVKDLGAKPGLEPNRYLRLAVKRPEENARAVAALEQVLRRLASVGAARAAA